MLERRLRRSNCALSNAWTLLLLLTFAADSPSAFAQSEAQAAADHLVIYAVRVNQQDLGEARLLKRGATQLLVARTDLQRWRVRVPEEDLVQYNGEDFVPLAVLAGADVKVDEGNQSVEIELHATAFEESVVDLNPAAEHDAAPAPWGGHLTYDLLWEKGKDTQAASAVLDLGVFGPPGVWTSTALLQDIRGAIDQRSAVRLESTWSYDSPRQMRSVQIGDALSSAGQWGRAVRYGGLRIARNFATAPGFVSLARPSLRAETLLPSSVDLYVNDVLRRTFEVQPGAFSVPDLPVVSGSGEVRMVVRDLLGRETVLTQPYTASDRLLRRGLLDYSVDIGFPRERFGAQSNEYGSMFAAMQARYGFSETFTGEARAELTHAGQSAGVGASLATPVGVFSGAIAASSSDVGTGIKNTISLEGGSARTFYFGLRFSVSNKRFTQLGDLPDAKLPWREAAAHVGKSFGRFGSLGASYAQQDMANGQSAKVASTNWNLRLGKRSSLVVTGLVAQTETQSKALFVNFVRLLGEATSLSAAQTLQRDANQSTLQLHRSLPVGPGTAWRALLGRDPQRKRAELGWVGQNRLGTLGLDAAVTDDATQLRVGAAGALVTLGRGLYPARRVLDSFAIVELPGYANVRVYTNDQLAGRTNHNGAIVLPDVLPYQRNKLRVEASDLPLDTHLDVTEIETVPRARSGILVQFPVKRVTGALLSVWLDDGNPLPTGAVLHVRGREELFPVGLRGEVYVADLPDDATLIAVWNEQSCELRLPPKPNDSPIPKYPSMICRGVKR